jgi:hypothetical protein
MFRGLNLHCLPPPPQNGTWDEHCWSFKGLFITEGGSGVITTPVP